MIGHRPKEVLLQLLRGANVSKEIIEAAKLFKCDACTQATNNIRTHPVSAPNPHHTFNQHVHVDVLFIHDDEGELFQFLSIVCIGTRMHQVGLSCYWQRPAHVSEVFDYFHEKLGCSIWMAQSRDNRSRTP